MSLKIAIAQINATVGDFAGNTARIVDFAERARAQGADLLLTPELALCGYPPEDLLLRDDFCAACERELDLLAGRLQGIAVLVGHPEKRGERCYNAATLLSDGVRVATYYKQRLPSYEVFDEERYFDSGEAPCVLTLKGVRCGVNICADVWEAGAADLAREAGAEVLLVLNASPYHIGKQERRTEVLRQRIASTGLPVVYANLAGGQDELVFDGGSFVLDSHGTVCCQLPQFEEALAVVDFVDGQPQPGMIVPAPGLEAEVYQALVLGVRDYLGKNGFPGAIIGLSGGIDSALTLCIAVDALGADKVRAVMMSCLLYTSPWTGSARTTPISRLRPLTRRESARRRTLARSPTGRTAFRCRPAFHDRRYHRLLRTRICARADEIPAGQRRDAASAGLSRPYCRARQRGSLMRQEKRGLRPPFFCALSKATALEWSPGAKRCAVPGASDASGDRNGHEDGHGAHPEPIDGYNGCSRNQ